MAENASNVNLSEPDLYPKPTRSLIAVLVVCSFTWLLLLIPSRDIAVFSSSLIPIGEFAQGFKLSSIFESVYYLNLSSGPFTITLGLVGAWSFYFIRSYRAVLFFLLLPLLSFTPLAIKTLVQLLT